MVATRTKTATEISGSVALRSGIQTWSVSKKSGGAPHQESRRGQNWRYLEVTWPPDFRTYLFGVRGRESGLVQISQERHCDVGCQSTWSFSGCTQDESCGRRLARRHPCTCAGHDRPGVGSRVEKWQDIFGGLAVGGGPTECWRGVCLWAQSSLRFSRIDAQLQRSA